MRVGDKVLYRDRPAEVVEVDCGRFLNGTTGRSGVLVKVRNEYGGVSVVGTQRLSRDSARTPTEG